MHLRAFLKGIEVIATTGDLEREIEGIACDSRHVEQNFAFVCYQGVNVDGHEYIPNAIDRGATAVISELPLRPSVRPLRGASPPCAGLRLHSLRERKLSVPEGVSLVQVKDGRLALAIMAANWYDIPAERLKIIGITGTNGKTSTAHLIQSVFTAAGCKMGIVGSVGHKVGNRFIPATTTTPDALHLHKLLKDMADDGEDSVVMEVTSHSLEQKRVAGILFDVAVFTNLTQDHLDFHSDMRDYLDAKVKLFQQLKNNSIAILNADDDASDYIRERTNASIPDSRDGFAQLTYGVEKPADLYATGVESTINRLSFTAITPVGNIDVQLKLLGEYNLYNALAAIGVGLSQGFALDVIKSGLESATVPGRFELVDCGQDFAVVVDYAHTPDALERLLKAARKITKGAPLRGTKQSHWDKLHHCAKPSRRSHPENRGRASGPENRGRLICVFGCGGDRDRGKRPIMGRIASEIADHVVITSDNPRTEEPEQITAEIEGGIKEGANYDVIISRNAAIAHGIEIARNGDLVVIAGKGHENYQIFKDKRIHFDDREVAAEHLRRVRSKE